MTDLPPAGWFTDPEDPSQQRYWDGTAWTAHRTPATPQAPAWGTEPGSSYAQQGSAYPQRGPETSSAAIAALIMGILSIVACLGPITGIPAIVVGRRATRDIDAAGGQVEGRGLATGGVVTGLIGTLIWVLVAAFFIFAVVVLRTSSTA